MSQELGDLLVSSGALTEEQLREALAFQRNGDLTLPESLQKLALVDEVTLYRAVAKQHGMPFVNLDKGRIPQAILDRVPTEVATEQGILPLMEKGGKLVVAIDDPFKRILADQLSFVIGSEVACALATPTAHRQALARYFGDGTEQAVAASMGSSEDQDIDDAPIVRLVTRMFSDALDMRASDIHIEPGHGRVRIRFRVDGMLRDIVEHPEHLAAPLMSRLKIMAKMDIAEKRKPQDGRIGLVVKGRDIDVRASILPTNHGETMVMRLLDRSANLLSLRDLGFNDDDRAWFQRVIKRPTGICLVTGPTGSGKTTTLYAALQELNRPDVKIITAEDPVEYYISGINQVQVADRIGLTFARILKAMLRCAPNIILVGEIRDLATAEIAIQAALTGHLVFSTLHTNDAPSALTRLVDLGVKPFLVSASVQAVLAQRLVRRLCLECAGEYAPSEGELRGLGLDPRLVQDRTFRRPRGCRSCEGSGYHGRVALYERMQMDQTLREMTFRERSLEELRSTALATGALHGILADGARKVIEGITSVNEILRVTRGKA
ncbi:MAG: GspE/PulE family protein [Planctomycetota bacterium]